MSASNIPLSVPLLKGNEWKYVKDCLDSGWVSSVGGYVTRFEDAVKKYLGMSHAVACVNGTSALHIALLAVGVIPGDEVIVPALTFVAPANAVRYAGAHPVFMDAEAVYWQMDAAKLQDFCARQCDVQQGRLVNRQTGRTVRAIVPVDVLGHPCDMDAIMGIARQYGLKVVEDNAESLGSRYKEHPTGKRADMTCLSFNGNKIITAGGGGMVVTDNSALAERARYLSTQAKDDPIEYIHHEIGYNARLTGVQAAMGLAQLELLDGYVEKKRAIAKRYDEAFRNVPGLSIPSQAPWARSSYWLYTIMIDGQAYGKESRALLKTLESQGIQSRPLWHPLHQLKPFCDCMAYQVEVAIALYQRCLSLPSSVGLTEEDQERVIKAVRL